MLWYDLTCYAMIRYDMVCVYTFTYAMYTSGITAGSMQGSSPPQAELAGGGIDREILEWVLGFRLQK